MGKKSRLKAVRREEWSKTEPRELPHAIVRGAEQVRAEASKSGELLINLQSGAYRETDSFFLEKRHITVGSLGTSTKPLRQEKIRYLFELATSIAAQGEISTNSFNPKTHKLEPVLAKVAIHDVDGFLVNIPVGAAQLKRDDNSLFTSSFTTGLPILGRGDPSISFVTTGPTIRPADCAMNTATEVIQNRCIVESVVFNDGKERSYADAIHPFQENLANGIGNMAGAAMLGWRYSQYLEFLKVYDHSNLWAGTIRGLLGKEAQFIAPHIMFNEEAYDQVAAQEIPALVIPLARQPIPR